MFYYLQKGIDNLKSNGLRDTVVRTWHFLGRPAVSWKGMRARSGRQSAYDAFFRSRLPSESEQEEQRKTVFSYRPLFSILVPLYETEERYLRELIESVQAQTYDGWELCLSDGSKDPARLEKILAPYCEHDPRIRRTAKRPGPLGISANTDQAFEIANGDFIVLGDHDDLFTPDALFACAQALNADRTIDVLYSDEDKTNERADRFFDPVLKPMFNDDLLNSGNYITHMFVVRKDIAERTGLFREEYNGAQDYDFILRCTEIAAHVHHIPRVLYHWRINETSTAGNPNAKRYAYDAGRRALQAHYDRLGLPRRASMSEDLGFYNTAPEEEPVLPRVSVLVADCAEPRKLRNIRKILKEMETGLNCELLIAGEEERAGGEAAAYNALAARAKGEVLILISGRMLAGQEHALTDMVRILTVREDIGALGPKVLCRGGGVRHAGVILEKDRMAEEVYLETEWYDNVLFQLKDAAALRRECLVVRTSAFREAGGLPETYALYSTAVLDLCLRLGRNGLRCAYAGQILMLYGPCRRDRNKEGMWQEKAAADRRQFTAVWGQDGIVRDRYYADRIKEKDTKKEQG